jgi:putative transposase
VLIPGQRHLRKVLAGYSPHYNDHRPHHALQQQPPQRQPIQATGTTARINRTQVLDGLLNEYRKAA